MAEQKKLQAGCFQTLDASEESTLSPSAAVSRTCAHDASRLCNLWSFANTFSGKAFWRLERNSTPPSGHNENVSHVQTIHYNNEGFKFSS